LKYIALFLEDETAESRAPGKKKKKKKDCIYCAENFSPTADAVSLSKRDAPHLQVMPGF
jgi:hypothetical protein